MNLNKDDFTYFQLTYPKIIESIRLVASSPEIQISVFHGHMYPPDEIADIIEHTVLMSKTLKEKKYITQKQYDSVKDIDDKFNKFTKEDWTIEALYQADTWAITRFLAQKALSEFSVAYAPPNLYWFITL